MNKDPSVSLGLSPCVLGSFRWWWCHCLGHALAERAHAIHLFSTVFHRETEGARGLWLNSHLSLPCPPPHPSSLLTTSSFSSVSVTFWLQRWLCVIVLSFPSPTKSSSFSILLKCHCLPPLSHSICPSVFLASCTLCLQMRSKESYEPEMERNVSVIVFFWTYLLGLHMCKKDQKNELRSAVAKKSISIWPCRDWKGCDY